VYPELELELALELELKLELELELELKLELELELNLLLIEIITQKRLPQNNFYCKTYGPASFTSYTRLLFQKKHLVYLNKTFCFHPA